MAQFRSLGALGSSFDKLAKSIGGEGARQIATAMGKEAQKLATRAASADLGGDPKFSGWAPVLDTQIRHLEPGSLILMPTRSSAGPWTVAERGRNQGGASGFHGPGANKVTGETSRTKSGALRKVRATKGKRWNGTTRGKGTARDAVQAIEKAMPKVVEREMAKVVHKFLN